MPRRSLKEKMLAPFDRGEDPLWLKIVWAPIGLLVFLEEVSKPSEFN
jgi:hypothetical protein